MEKLLKKLKIVEKIQNKDKIILVDVSSTDYLKGHINFDNVIEVIDHHF
jgi:inorganic pyrophosphatase/exopolyphosphatase